MNIKIKDPVSGISHLLGAILSIFGTVVLIYLAAKEDKVIHVVSFAVFGASMIFLYTSSAIYHLFGHSPEEVDIYRKIDHAMIYILIAGTYTPFCLIALRGLWGYPTIIVIWLLALAGISTVFFKAFWAHVPRWIATALYIVMGWLSLIIIWPMYKAIGLSPVLWLLAGGIAYTVGAIIYAKKQPNFWKGFGFHELFHILVLLGTMCHFWAIYKYLLPVV